jgi:branched-chain amino acid transport system substrate-binding protein
VTRAVRIHALASALALFVCALAGPGRAQSLAPYEIYAILPLTGSAAFLGETEATTFKIVEKKINETGGIHGHPVHFVTSDDASSPQTDLQLITPLIAKHVPVIFDGGPLAMCRAVVPLATNGPVVYCLSPALYPAAGSYVFSTSASSEDESHALVNFIKSKGWKRVAIMTPTDATGQEADRVFRDLFALPAFKALAIVDYEHFAPSDLSVAAQVAKIKDAHPDVVMAWGTGTATATEYRALKDAGLNVPVVGANGNQQYALMEQWASILPDQYYQYSMKFLSYGDISAGPVKNAIAAMYKAFAAAGQRPDVGASLVWDPVNIVVAALRALPENPTPQQLRDAILQMHNYAGINGFYDFRVGNQRGLTIKDCTVVRYDRRSKTFVPVTGSAGLPS